MDGLLSLLIFTGLLFVMMRFGCGAHMLRGHRDQKRSTDAQQHRHTDPVCGKSVPPTEGYGMMHEGQLYRFCSRECLSAFEVDPDRFGRQALEVTSQQRTTH